MAEPLPLRSMGLSDADNVRDGPMCLFHRIRRSIFRAIVNCPAAVLHLDILTLVGGFMHTNIEGPLYRNAQLQLCVNLLCIGYQTTAIGTKSDFSTVSATAAQCIIVFVVVQRFTEQADSL
jgi:hypothetical protein